jgi:hypothetical protein
MIVAGNQVVGLRSHRAVDEPIVGWVIRNDLEMFNWLDPFCDSRDFRNDRLNKLGREPEFGSLEDGFQFRENWLGNRELDGASYSRLKNPARLSPKKNCRKNHISVENDDH